MRSSTSTGARIVDLVDETPGQSRIFYEMKSVKNLPPNDFNNQFFKDLNNLEVTSLSQIRWKFNGAKNPTGPNGEAFETAMENAVDNMTNLTDDLARKFVGRPDATVLDLKTLIKSNLGSVFSKVGS